MAAKGFELARFRLKAGVDEAGLANASRQMEDDYLRLQAGFVAHHLARLDDGAYAYVAIADTRADAERICQSWIGQPQCEAFLALIDAESIQFGNIL